ncbi:MAG: bifunctional diaminohydroxyphosphoribosylaminopyrimidine deaminase/5-amino-6-(5-phosphoribosylamino)uracil reductase RibD [Planctomycetota bacterium]|nr:bifunctional diaminohydroxyphosphoribosylaminopyrimidine deaminase/5-amino-6-(5-phosphoribosylamino)uracil reductase RibD [Planctomycetota bacterium]
MKPDSESNEDCFMSRALVLARRGRGAVEPNPMVGAVIVREGHVIGEGWHKRFGGPHAEIEAIAAAHAAGEETAGATMYVTLEPCCRTGKTPPCTKAIIAAGVSRVVAAMEDPDANVAGGGFHDLRQADIKVVTGVMEAEVRRFLAAYIKLRTKGAPWVICKWAQSLDGKIATHKAHSKWITGAAARRRVHEIRSLCDGVCVGAGTVRADDPLLTSRDADDNAAGRQPARLILDGSATIPPDCRLIQSIDISPVIVAVREDASTDSIEALTGAGAEVLVLPAGDEGVDLSALLEELGRREWTYLLVEGGRGVHSAFLAQGLVDELLVFVAPLIIGGSGSLGPVDWTDIDTIDEAFALPKPQVEQIGDDVLLRYVLSK